jgi:hypothetical protein
MHGMCSFGEGRCLRPMRKCDVDPHKQDARRLTSTYESKGRMKLFANVKDVKFWHAAGPALTGSNMNLSQMSALVQHTTCTGFRHLSHRFLIYESQCTQGGPLCHSLPVDVTVRGSSSATPTNYWWPDPVR